MNTTHAKERIESGAPFGHQMAITMKKAGQNFSVTRLNLIIMLVGARGFEPPTP